MHFGGWVSIDSMQKRLKNNDNYQLNGIVSYIFYSRFTFSHPIK